MFRSLLVVRRYCRLSIFGGVGRRVDVDVLRFIRYVVGDGGRFRLLYIANGFRSEFFFVAALGARRSILVAWFFRSRIFR